MPHSSSIVNVHEAADGILSVTIRCCGDPKTDSVVSIHELARSEEEIDQDVAVHRSRVEKMHEAKGRVKAHLERIAGMSPGDCGCQK